MHTYNLPPSLAVEIAKYLDTNTLSQAKLISKYWQKFFSTAAVWEEKLITEYFITPKILGELNSLIKDINYEVLYQRLFWLRLNAKNLPGATKFLYKDKTNQLLLSACCLDEANYFLKSFSQQEAESWLLLSLYAGSKRIPQALLLSSCVFLSVNAFFHAAQSGNMSMLLWLIEQFNLKPDQSILTAAANSGNKQLVQHLITTFYLKPNQEILNRAAYSGSKLLVQHIIQIFKLNPDQDTLDNAAYSGNLLLLQYLIQSFNLTPNYNTLTHAVSSGNLVLVQYLAEQFHLLRASNWIFEYIAQQVDKVMPRHLNLLRKAAASDNLALMQYLLAKCNYQQIIQPINRPCDGYSSILYPAALSGSTSLVKYFIETLNISPVAIDTIFTASVQSGNLELVNYLKENFNFSLAHLGTWVHSKPGGLNFRQSNGTEIAIRGNIKFFKFFKEKLQVKKNHEWLNTAASQGHTDLVKYLIKELNYTPNGFTLECAMQSGNQSLIHFLLDPINKFNLVVDEYTFSFINNTAMTNIPNREYLKNYLKGAVALSLGLNLLRQGQLDATQFKNAHTFWPLHFYQFVETALIQPEALEINSNSKAYQDFLALDIVYHTPFPMSQYKLAKLSMEGKIMLSSEKLTNLCTKAKIGFEYIENSKLINDVIIMLTQVQHIKRSDKIRSDNDYLQSYQCRLM